MAKVSDKQTPSDLLIVGEFVDRGYTTDEIARQCPMSIDAIIRLKKQVEKNQQKELESNATMVIYRAIDALEKIYHRQIELQSEQHNKVTDIKTMQGVERCLELKMKLLGFDGKQQFMPTQTNCSPTGDDIVIDLNDLSQQTIQELNRMSKITLKNGERMKESNN